MDNTLRPILNTPEVASLFSHPLASFLSDSAPVVSANPDPEQDSASPEQDPDAHAELVAAELPYHTYSDLTWPQHTRGEAITESIRDCLALANSSRLIRTLSHLHGLLRLLITLVSAVAI